MRLICDCDTAGHDVSVYALIDLNIDVARRLLALQATHAAAKQANRDVHRVTLWEASCEWYFEGLPDGLSDEQHDELDQAMADADDGWAAIPEGLVISDEPRAHVDIERTETSDTGVYLTAYVGDIPVETRELTWDKLREVAGPEPDGLIKLEARKIDWELLRDQKRWLVEQRGDHAEGLLNFIDWIQDTALGQRAAAEDEVFREVKTI